MLGKHAGAIGLYDKSPSWHRRERRKRAAARARIRLSRSLCKEPALADIQFLSGHHSRPSYKELYGRMGKRGGWDAAARKEYDYGYDSSYWPQSGSSYGRGDWPSKGQGKKPGKEAKPERGQVAFPSYEAMAVPNHKGGKAVGKQLSKTTTEVEPELVGATGDLARYVQKLVNTLRRSDGKLRRCEMDKDEAQAKWDEYQKHLKQSFIQERQRYREKLDKVQAEQEEYIKAKNGALQELQEIIADPTQLTRPRRALGSEAASAEWEELMAATSDPWADLPDLLAGAATSGRELQAAARQQLLGALNMAKEKTEVAHTPPRRPHQPPPMSPPPTERTTVQEDDRGGESGTYSGAVRPAGSDPYQTSPSTSRAPMPTIRSRSRSHNAGPRVPVKTHLKGPIKTGKHASLAEKLDEKRANALAGNTVVEVETEDDEEDVIGDLTAKTAAEMEE